MNSSHMTLRELKKDITSFLPSVQPKMPRFRLRFDWGFCLLKAAKPKYVHRLSYHGNGELVKPLSPKWLENRSFCWFYLLSVEEGPEFISKSGTWTAKTRASSWQQGRVFVFL